MVEQHLYWEWPRALILSPPSTFTWPICSDSSEQKKAQVDLSVFIGNGITFSFHYSTCSAHEPGNSKS
ncbi:hypothetical protein H4Q26_007748 [Puccinia striiformis f. sp. tritici PST-130]|nr:hypothetical protein H4Q26_007748 [Puccinia striiformis f. sp. tritici PST-130]